jgi:DNA mismatch repair ATPase MutS
LIPQLTPDNALAYSSPTGPARKGTLLEYVMKEKKRHSDKVLLVRVGDFYESYGIDAIMLVQYAGLNPMGGRARAGCPIRNIQATLDGLTSSGLAVAIYEELNDVNAARGPSSKAGLKRRTLSQIVSPGASTYLYDLRMRHENIDFKENRPAVGIAYSEALGYSMCEVHLDERVMYVSERLTDEAVRIALECTGACVNS